MLRDRYDPMNLFDHIPALGMETDTVLTHLDSLLDDEVQPIVSENTIAVHRWNLNLLLKRDSRDIEFDRDLITPPSTDELLNRLTGRNTESPAALAVRQKEALIELGLAQDYEHVVCNRDVDETAREILAMIAAQYERRQTRV